MTANGYLQLGLLRGRPARAREAARRLHGAHLRGRAGGPEPHRRARSSGCSTASAASTREREMRWTEYAVAVLAFNVLGLLAVYALQRLQGWLPLNPQDLGAVSPDSSFNTAVSFATNTNWQGYGGETTMSYLTQMLGLAVQNFVSAATGMAVLVALIRGFARASASTIGNFWVDLVAEHALHPAAALDRRSRSSSSRRASCRRSRAYQTSAGQPVDYDAEVDADGQPSGREGKPYRAATAGADHRRRPGRLAGRDQAARHERRRLLQRQLGASASRTRRRSRTSSRCSRSC